MSENLDLMSTPTLSSFTVYIIEDDDAVRKSVVMLLQACGYHCLDFSAAQPFLDFYQQHQMFGCILLDVRMPGMSGMTLHKKLIALGSATPIIFVTAHGDIPMAVEALHSGAVDFISKPYREQDLIEKLNDVQQQQQQLLELNQKVMDIKQSLNSLTDREKQVLDYIVSGSANKVIAIELSISERTVEVHRSKIMKKMQVNSIAVLCKKVMMSTGMSAPYSYSGIH